MLVLDNPNATLIGMLSVYFVLFNINVLCMNVILIVYLANYNFIYTS
jgi:hypothetical protein